jgi:hypothetical protein
MPSLPTMLSRKLYKIHHIILTTTKPAGRSSEALSYTCVADHISQWLGAKFHPAWCGIEFTRIFRLGSAMLILTPALRPPGPPPTTATSTSSKFSSPGRISGPSTMKWSERIAAVEIGMKAAREEIAAFLGVGTAQ